MCHSSVESSRPAPRGRPACVRARSASDRCSCWWLVPAVCLLLLLLSHAAARFFRPVFGARAHCTICTALLFVFLHFWVCNRVYGRSRNLIYSLESSQGRLVHCADDGGQRSQSSNRATPRTHTHSTLTSIPAFFTSLGARLLAYSSLATGLTYPPLLRCLGRH